MKTLVLGIGNLLSGDGGLGVHAARKLLENDLPEETKVLEIGTSILDALPDLEVAERVIVIDAMNGECEPGTVYRILLDQCRNSLCIGTMHGFDLFRVLELAKRDIPPQVLLFGVEPADLDVSMELSSEVSNALPFLLAAVAKEINLRANAIGASSKEQNEYNYF